MTDFAINVRSKAKPSGSYDVTSAGELSRQTTDADRALFGISDSSVKTAIGAIWNRSPNDVFFNDPTNWSDQTFARYGWSPLQLVLKPVKWGVIAFDVAQTAVSERVIKNEFDKKISVNARFDTAMEDSVTTSWSQTSTLAVSQSISFGYKLFGAETSLSFTQEWQKGGSETSTVTIGSGVDIMVDLDPKEAVKVTNMANLGTATIEVEYEAHLAGGFFTNYYPAYQVPSADSAHHFYFMDVDRVLLQLQKPNKLAMKLAIEVSAYQYSETTIERHAGNAAGAAETRILHVNPSFLAAARSA